MRELGFHPAATAVTTDDARAGRNEVEREIAASPGRVRAAFAELLHAPPSRERSLALADAFDRGYAAFTRRDWEMNTYAMHPDDYVFEGGGGTILLDLPARLCGVEEYIDGMNRWISAWSAITLRSEGVADAGDGRLLNWATFDLRGGASGLVLEQATAVLYEWRGEWLVNQQYWWDRDAGTRAAGVDPAAIVRPR